MSPMAQTHRSLKQNKTKQCTTGAGRGNRGFNLIRQGQRSRSPKPQTYRSLIKKKQKAHDRHGPWGTSLLSHLVETTISLPQGTNLSFSRKENTENAQQARAVGNVVTALFGRDNDLAPPRHRPIAFL